LYHVTISILAEGQVLVTANSLYRPHTESGPGFRIAFTLALTVVSWSSFRANSMTFWSNTCDTEVVVQI
jgi:hypothetical protein